MTCPYCTSEDIKKREIVTDGLASAFLTNIPITPGHALVIPTRHVARYEDLTADERASIEGLRQKVMAALKASFGAEGFNFAWNDGAVAGQSVPHFHIHIVPRAKGDAGIYGYEPRQFLYRPGSREATPEEELRAVAELVRRHVVH